MVRKHCIQDYVSFYALISVQREQDQIAFKRLAVAKKKVPRILNIQDIHQFLASNTQGEEFLYHHIND